MSSSSDKLITVFEKIRALTGKKVKENDVLEIGELLKREHLEDPTISSPGNNYSLYEATYLVISPQQIESDVFDYKATFRTHIIKLGKIPHQHILEHIATEGICRCGWDEGFGHSKYNIQCNDDSDDNYDHSTNICIAHQGFIIKIKPYVLEQNDNKLGLRSS